MIRQSARRRFCGGSEAVSNVSSISSPRLDDRSNNDDPGLIRASHSMSESDSGIVLCVMSRVVCLSHVAEL